MKEDIKEMYFMYLINHYPDDFVAQILSSTTIDGTYYRIEARTIDGVVKQYVIRQEELNAWLFNQIRMVSDPPRSRLLNVQ